MTRELKNLKLESVSFVENPLPHQTIKILGVEHTIERGKLNMLKTVRYTRRPFTVDAVQVTAENVDQIAEWCGGTVRTDGEKGKYVKVRVPNPATERQTKAFVGDWVLYSGKGYKVFTNRSFNATFKPTTEEQPVHKEAPAPGVLAVDPAVTAVHPVEVDPVDEMLALANGSPVVRTDS